MGDYLVVSCARRDEAALGLSRQLADQARSEGWQVCDMNAHAWLAVRGPGKPTTLVVGSWTLIGDVFNRRSPIFPETQADDPWDYERKLVARFWGRFVGISFGPDHQIAALLRDPSGARECVTWTEGGLNFVSSTAPVWLIRRVRPAWRIDMERLAYALQCEAGAGLPICSGKAYEPSRSPLQRPYRP